jgi:hypothetical protein
VTLHELEREAIIDALKRHHGSQMFAARDLGITSRVLHYKIHTVHHLAWRLLTSELEVFDADEWPAGKRPPDPAPASELGPTDYNASIADYFNALLRRAQKHQ